MYNNSAHNNMYKGYSYINPGYTAAKKQKKRKKKKQKENKRARRFHQIVESPSQKKKKKKEMRKEKKALVRIPSYQSIYPQQIPSLGHLPVQCITNRRYKGNEKGKREK